MTYDVIARARRTTTRRVAIAGLAVGLVAGAVAAAAVWAGTRPAGPRAATSAARPAAAGSNGPAVPPLGGPAAGNQVLPADLAWIQLAGMALPVSARSGPRDTSGGLARGFAHDTGGAVLAAVHLVVRVSPQVGPAVFEPTLRAQVIGPAAGALRDQVTQQYQQLCDQARVACGQPIGGLYATLRGYRVDLYTDTNATLRLLTASPRPGRDPLLTAAVIQLTWTGADWALVAPTGGGWQQSITAVAADSTSTYLPFDTGR